MLGWQYSGETTGKKHLSAPSRIPAARLTFSPGTEPWTLAHEQKHSGRRHRRHPCKAADVAAPSPRISFRITHQTAPAGRRNQEDRSRMEIRSRFYWFSGTGARRTNHKRSQASGQRLG